jgi:crotonobetainyl-CoA:carnitine CoA-transferase CaiB-like acyl-CoA transferase
MKTIGVPVKLSETPGSIRRPAPLLGEHTDEVIAEWTNMAVEAADD